MRKMIVLGTVAMLMVLALAAAAMPLGEGNAQDQAAFPGERSIEVHGAGSTFGGTFHEPGITTSGKGIIVEGAGATFGGNLQEP
jgi:hypothetical protein